MRYISNSRIAATALALLALPTLADSNKSPFSVSADIGYEYDSNVSVDELDASIKKSDNRVTADIDLDFKTKLSDKLSFNAGYSFSDRQYEEFDRFDLRMNMLSTGLGYKMGKSSLDAKVFYLDAKLGGEDYLSMESISPSVSHYLTKNIYLRGAYNYYKKDFDQFDQRDADTYSISADSYYFIDGSSHYVAAGYRFKDEDTEADIYDYQSHQYKLRWVKKFPFWNNNARVQLAYSLEQRDYDDPASAGNTTREDDRHKYALDIQLPLSKQLHIGLIYEYSDYISTLASSEYDQEVMGVHINYKF